jgi:hypothetical protein
MFSSSERDAVHLFTHIFYLAARRIADVLVSNAIHTSDRFSKAMPQSLHPDHCLYVPSSHPSETYPACSGTIYAFNIHLLYM